VTFLVFTAYGVHVGLVDCDARGQWLGTVEFLRCDLSESDAL
jgi:hypothetical protein